MSTLRTRASKGSALTHNELDANFKRPVSQKTTTYSCLVSDNRSIIEGNHASTPFTITLGDAATMQASETGDYEVTITNINAAAVTVARAGTDTIDGSATSLTLNQWDSVTLAVNSAGDGYKSISKVIGDTVANHIKAGNMYLVDGSNQSYTNFSATANITEAAYETVGPTGSGATNIWADMDSLPDNARILIVDLQQTLSTSGATAAVLTTYASDGDLTPSITQDSVIAAYTSDIDAAQTGTSGITTRVHIPLNSSQVFKMTWAATGDDIVSLTAYYKGFIVN